MPYHRKLQEAEKMMLAANDFSQLAYGLACDVRDAARVARDRAALKAAEAIIERYKRAEDAAGPAKKP